MKSFFSSPSVWGNETNQNETKLQRLFVRTKMGMRFPSRWLVKSFCVFVPTKIQNKDCSSERKYRNSQRISDQEISFSFSFCIFVNVSLVYTNGPVQNSPSPSSLLPAYNTCLKKHFFAPQKSEPPCAPLNVVKFFGFPVQNSPSPSLPVPAYNTCLKKIFFLLLRNWTALRPL